MIHHQSPFLITLVWYSYCCPSFGRGGKQPISAPKKVQVKIKFGSLNTSPGFLCIVYDGREVAKADRSANLPSILVILTIGRHGGTPICVHDSHWPHCGGVYRCEIEFCKVLTVTQHHEIQELRYQGLPGVMSSFNIVSENFVRGCNLQCMSFRGEV